MRVDPECLPLDTPVADARWAGGKKAYWRDLKRFVLRPGEGAAATAPGQTTQPVPTSNCRGYTLVGERGRDRRNEVVLLAGSVLRPSRAFQRRLAEVMRLTACGRSATSGCAAELARMARASLASGLSGKDPAGLSGKDPAFTTPWAQRKPSDQISARSRARKLAGSSRRSCRTGSTATRRTSKSGRRALGLLPPWVHR